MKEEGKEARKKGGRECEGERRERSKKEGREGGYNEGEGGASDRRLRLHGVGVGEGGCEGGGNATSLMCFRFFRSQPKTVSSDESGDSKMEVSHLGSLGKI